VLQQLFAAINGLADGEAASVEYSRVLGSMHVMVPLEAQKVLVQMWGITS
jgi:hypothetical protein